MEQGHSHHDKRGKESRWCMEKELAQNSETVDEAVSSSHGQRVRMGQEVLRRTFLGAEELRHCIEIVS